ncbi:MAG: RNA polymerase subunit sigma-70 [Rhodovulum sulfidophilum]|uniref:RNA polymerase subunit sigma-70 n=1 Tax=Rhodovulum sulfidophilum TaxID=35806 RepID=A0A2W5NEP7_RHOSU|nr:MAG: RNA polymerase subunit sigma-70 [Rhodovulum sulfidophilum]
MSPEFANDLVRLVPRLRRFALGLCGNAHDADDLVQAACERALKNEAAFCRGSRMDSWMYRIIQNLWLDTRRRSKVRGTAVDPLEAGLDDEGRGARTAEDKMLLSYVLEQMDRLPEAQRVVLTLVAVEGLSYREVAEILEIPMGTVTSRLVRAREALATSLSPRAAAQ